MPTIAIKGEQIKFHREQCVYWHFFNGLLTAQGNGARLQLTVKGEAAPTAYKIRYPSQ
jgi:hypothetical protein